MKSFVKQFISLVKGDDTEVLAQRVLRQADSALKAKLSSSEYETIQLEDSLETAKENLNLALLNNGKVITDRDSYTNNLLTAKNNLTKSEEDLNKHLKKIEFFKEQYSLLEK